MAFTIQTIGKAPVWGVDSDAEVIKQVSNPYVITSIDGSPNIAKAEVKNGQGQVVGAVIYDRTHTVNMSGWIASQSCSTPMPGMSGNFCGTNPVIPTIFLFGFSDSTAYTLDSFNISESNEAAASFSMTMTVYEFEANATPSTPST